MARKVVSYSRPVIDKLLIKLTEAYILAFAKDVSTYIQTLIVNWSSFIEIGEIACSTPAWCTHGLTLKDNCVDIGSSSSIIQLSEVSL